MVSATQRNAQKGDLLLSTSEFESNGKVNTNPTLSTFLFRDKTADISRASLGTDPLPSVKIGDGASTPSPLFTEGGGGEVWKQTIRDLSVGFETWRLVVNNTLLHERTNGSYCKSLIGYINEIFIDLPTATFPALFCKVRKGNT